MLQGIQRAHKLKRAQEEFLRRLHESDTPAHQRTAQEFFTHLAIELDKEEYTYSMPLEQERIIIQAYLNEPQRRWAKRKIANRYNITENQLQRIMQKHNVNFYTI